MLENDLWPSCLVMLITVWSLRTINIITQYNHCSLNLYFWHAAACSFNWILITCRYEQEHASGQHAMAMKRVVKNIGSPAPAVQHCTDVILNLMGTLSEWGNIGNMSNQYSIIPPSSIVITQLAIFPSHKSSKKMCFECLKVVVVLIQLLLCMSYTSVSRVSVLGLAGGSTDIGFQ